MQKKYVIDEYITFTPADGCLCLIETSDKDVSSHLLPPPAARLLFVLLQHNGELVTKENLLAEVWENYGMTGSLHNLAHYTMLIRKAFKALHYEKKIIITVHKQGMMINPEISYSVFSSEQQDNQPPGSGNSDNENFFPEETILPELSTEYQQPETKVQSAVVVSKQRNKVRFWFIFSIIFFCILGVGFTGYYFFSDNHSRFSTRYLRLIETDNKCKFYTYNDKVDDQQLMRWIRMHTGNFNLHCKKDMVIIYYTDAFLGPNITGKKFHTNMTLCLDSQDPEELHSCVSHYYN